MKKTFILVYLCCWVECFTGTFLNNSSLAFSQPKERILVITLYLIPNCPHALAVLPNIKIWIQNQGIHELLLLPPTPFYPSPTLRIDYEEYGVNYIGKNDILALIQSNF